MANQNDPFAGVNMDIVNNALPPNVKANLQQVQSNLDEAVQGVVNSFAKGLQDNLTALTENGAAQLQQELDQVFSQSITPISDQLAALQQTVASMQAAAADNADLQEKLTAMSQHAAQLNQTVNDVRSKVATFGQTIGAGAQQILKKAIPLPLP